LRAGLYGLALLQAMRLRGARAAERSPAARSAPATGCIVLWMNGGPSHIDTFDPKPGTAVGGPFRAIATRTPGLAICEHLPRLAARTHDLLVVRGMSTREGNHDRAQYLMHTGYAPTPTLTHPALGSWVSQDRGDGLDLPSFISVGGPSQGAGFLGVSHAPFVMAKAGAPPENTEHAPGIDSVRFMRRRGALAALDQTFLASTHSPLVEQRGQMIDKAVRFMYSSRLRAFDLTDEPAAVTRGYGDTDFGRGCLLARRLRERGVPFVEVVLDGWDTHANNFERTKALMHTLDAAFAALLSDLAERNLLGRTLVVWMGEFGRTPRINENEGRDHHPAAWSAVIGGGGVRGGLVHGATSATGAEVVDGKVAVGDYFATLAALLGLDPDRRVITPVGRPITIADNGTPIAAWLQRP
jgi:hypothetical protein